MKRNISNAINIYRFKFHYSYCLANPFYGRAYKDSGLVCKCPIEQCASRKKFIESFNNIYYIKAEFSSLLDKKEYICEVNKTNFRDIDMYEIITEL